MKIIGILTGWGCQDWIEAAIKQGLEYTDELHVCISAHSDNLLKFKDNTYNIAKKYEKDINLFTHSGGKFHSTSKADILNNALKQSKIFDDGVWIWILDVDEFYKRETYEYVKKIISSNICDRITFEARYFFINLKHYIISDHHRLFKVYSNKCKFFPTQNWPYATKSVTVPYDSGMFHYSMMMNPYMKWEFWKTEYPYEQNHKLQWFDKIYRNYDLSDEDAWLRRNKALLGNLGPWICDAFKPDDNGRLFKYNGTHPKWVPERLIKIEDYRKHWKF